MKNIFYLFLFLISFTSTATEAKVRCQQLFAPIDASLEVGLNQYYDLASFINTRNAQLNRYKETLKFGYESEFTLDKYASGLLDYYIPALTFGIDYPRWQQMKAEVGNNDGRIEWVIENQSKLFENIRTPGQMFLTPDGKQKMPYLPQQLIVDYTGNLEIILKPFESYEKWKTASEVIAQEIGNGSLQSTVGILSNVFWEQVAAGNPKTVTGFLQFTADFDSIIKLQSGYERYDSEKQNRPYAAAFTHPFLGPMTALKRKEMDVYLDMEAKGQRLSDEQKEFVSYADSSWKYSGTTVYRPDIALGYMVFEVRDAHSNLKHLDAQINRMIYFVNEGFASFEKYHTIKPLDTVTDFARFPSGIAEFLKVIFPAKFIDPRVSYTAEEILANEVYRNFSFPLRDWSAILKVFDEGKAAQTLVGKAKLDYLQKLDQIEKRWKQKDIDDATARNQVQIALVEFIHDSKLFAVYLSQYRKHVGVATPNTFQKAQ